MTCDGLPDPGSLSEMNTYIFLWSMEDEKVDMNNFIVRYNIIIYVRQSSYNFSNIIKRKI